MAFIVYLDKQPENNKDFGSAVQHELEKLKRQAKKTAPKQTKTPDSTKKEQKFNFYTILPELEVLIPESETRPPARTSEAENKSVTNKTKKQYILQVGSFQNLADAKKLKVNLALLGLTADIQHVTVNNQQWHRVRTGPYQDKQQLYRNQSFLIKNDIHSISMELK